MMTNKKNTRKALLSSALSLVLCLAMLIGTTFAWFTDSVTSANNIIKSGNLDVTLDYWDGDSFEEVKDTTKLFNDEALWEPGHTEVAYLKIGNAGSLALKYQLQVNVYDETLGKTKDGADIRLSDYLVFSVIDIDESEAGTYDRETAIDKAGDVKGLKEYIGETTPLVKKGDADCVALVIYMPTTVGNEANHNGKDVPKIEMGVNLYATQFTSEEDSFNNQYDAGAYLPVVYSAEELESALENGESVNLVQTFL
jgi:predicted ribosomally synthesized peptide with SipW-like signal peptide